MVWCSTGTVYSMLRLMIKIPLVLMGATFKCLGAVITFWCDSCNSNNNNNLSSTAQQSNNSAPTDTDTDTIAKLDLIEALDSEIAVLAQEKLFYEQKSKDIKLSTEKQLKAQHKVAQLNTRIMTLTRRVLKLREELEK